MRRVFAWTLGVLLAFNNATAVAQVHDNVPNRSFYKDVFFDCGIGLTSLDTLPAFKMLGLSMERVAFTDKNDAPQQNAIIAGDSLDWNGHLLYPDGAPRFKVIFLNGGTSTIHGTSLGEAGRRRIREFVNAGGSYVGTCAGAILAAKGTDNSPNTPNFLGIWPGLFRRTGKARVNHGMTIDKSSKLLSYYDFGGDYRIDNVRHNLGNFPYDLPNGAEVLARFDFKGSNAHEQPAVAAYKASAAVGRIVVCGSHPEEVTSGERLDLTAGMIRYALDGVGMTTVKGFLNNGEPRVMDRYTYEGNPEYTRIGDLQTHHFAVDIPDGAKNVTFKLNGPEGSHFTLAICKDTYAYDDCADFVSTIEGATHQFTLPKAASGLWYVAVKCLDTVTLAPSSHQAHQYQRADGIDPINGVPYTIEVTWQ